MPIKITPTQYRILCELALPKGRASMLRPQGCAFVNNRAVRFDSLWVLLQKGLIEDVTPDNLKWRGSDYKITKAGRAARRDYEKEAGKKKND